RYRGRCAGQRLKSSPRRQSWPQNCISRRTYEPPTPRGRWRRSAMSRRGLVLAGVTAALLLSTSVPSVFAAGQHFRGNGFLVTKGLQKVRGGGHGTAGGTGRGVFAVKDNSGDTDVATTGSGAHMRVGQWDVYCGTGSASMTSSDA